MQTAIIIPIYNQEKYLVEAMEALLAQTSSDWIAYCVNDGSTDASASILADYAARDARLVVITQPNGGVSVARNTGIEAALANPRVDTCCFSDPDDVVHPRLVEVARHFAAQCHEGQIVTWDFECQSSVSAFRETRIDVTGLQLDDAVPTHNIWDKIYPRDMLRDVRFLVGAKIAQDMAFSMELIHKRHPIFKHIPAALTYYRIVPTSTMHRPLPAEYYERMCFVLEYMLSIYKDSPDELDDFCHRHQIGFLKQFCNYLRRALPEARDESRRIFKNELRSLRKRGLLRIPHGGLLPLKNYIRFWWQSVLP